MRTLRTRAALLATGLACAVVPLGAPALTGDALARKHSAPACPQPAPALAPAVQRTGKASRLGSWYRHHCESNGGTIPPEPPPIPPGPLPA
jgi:hypothetical protein